MRPQLDELFVLHPPRENIRFFAYIQWYVDSVEYALVNYEYKYCIIAVCQDYMDRNELLQEHYHCVVEEWTTGASDLILRSWLFEYRHPLFNPI